MFAAEFEYRKAGSVAEAVQLLSEHPEARLLAGGHSLIPLMRFRLARPAMLIDIGSIPNLRGINVEYAGVHIAPDSPTSISGYIIDRDTVRIGALTTHAEIAASPVVRQANGLLAEAAGGIGDPAVRNRGTIGGNLAHADPASDWATVLTALGATVSVQGPAGSRTIAVADLIEDAFVTALAENEVITTVSVPTLAANQRAEYAKMAHPASFYAVVGRGGGGDDGRGTLHRGVGGGRRADAASGESPGGRGGANRGHADGGQHRSGDGKPGRRPGGGRGGHHWRCVRFGGVPRGGGAGGGETRAATRHRAGASLAGSSRSSPGSARSGQTRRAERFLRNAFSVSLAQRPIIGRGRDTITDRAVTITFSGPLADAGQLTTDVVFPAIEAFGDALRLMVRHRHTQVTGHRPAVPGAAGGQRAAAGGG